MKMKGIEIPRPRDKGRQRAVSKVINDEFKIQAALGTLNNYYIQFHKVDKPAHGCVVAQNVNAINLSQAINLLIAGFKFVGYLQPKTEYEIQWCENTAIRKCGRLSVL